MIRNKNKLLALLLTTCLCFGTADITSFAAESNTQDPVSDDSVSDDSVSDDSVSDESPLLLSATYSSDNYSIDFTVYDKWKDGYNASVKITNTGNTPIDNWYISLDLANEITNIWNATIDSHTGNNYIIKNTTANQDIFEGETVEFGISVNEEFVDFPTNYKLISSKNVENANNYSIEYFLDGDWTYGYIGRIVITNNTNHAIEDWILEFDFNRSIDSIWTATIEENSGNHYVIKNAGYNANIEPNSSITFGFIGGEGEEGEEPTNYKLYSYSVNNSQSK